MKLLKKRSQGFTLIELLIVVSIMAILAVAALIAINPGEATAKARDVERLKQVADLQKVMEQWMQESTATTAFTAVSTANSGSQLCNGNGWLSAAGLNVCAYTNSLVVDPVNRASQTHQNSTAATTGTVAYEVTYDGAQHYRICTHLQSQANRAMLTSDGGIHTAAYEISNVTSGNGCSVVN